jgi:hypothetical protein
MGIQPTQGNEKRLLLVLLSVPNRIVIPRGCDFFDSCGFYKPNQKIFQNSHQAVITERSASQIYRLTEGFWRGVEEPVPSIAEGTPRMVVGRCSSELSGPKT